MAKFEAADDIGKPGKPPKHRKFPWRLWLWALVMTAAAGAGGYFTWHFKKEADEAVAAKTVTLEKADTDKKQLADQCKQECTADKTVILKENKDLKSQQDALSKNLNASKEQLDLAKVQLEQNTERLRVIDQMQEQFKKMIDSGSLKVTSRRGGLVLSLPAEVLFPSGVADLSEEGKVKVHEIGFTLKKEGAFKDRRFLVVGHSDNQPLKGSIFKDNWDLSAARALTVTRMLVQAGMKPGTLVAAGAGEHDPVVANNSAVNLARNRRIEIALLPEIPENLGDAKDAKPADKKPEPKKP
jgi:chemotaxis protein MotB